MGCGTTLNDEMVIAYDFLMADMKLNVAVDKMLRTAEAHEVDVVVIDTLTTVAGLGDEDNSSRVGEAMREFRRLANAGATPCSCCGTVGRSAARSATQVAAVLGRSCGRRGHPVADRSSSWAKTTTRTCVSCAIAVG